MTLIGTTPGPDIHSTTGSMLAIYPWSDPVTDATGHPVRSDYVEQFWLGILGPTATWLVRRLVAGFDHTGCMPHRHRQHERRDCGQAPSHHRTPPATGRGKIRSGQIGRAHV